LFALGIERWMNAVGGRVRSRAHEWQVAFGWAIFPIMMLLWAAVLVTG
jgi:hypothetical protein